MEFFGRNIFLRIFFDGIFLVEFFGRKFLGGFFWEDFLRGFFGRIFWGGFLGGFFWEEFFGRNSLFTLELTCLSRFWFLSRFCLNKEGRKDEGRTRI